VCLIVALTAVCIVSNYALIGLPNVKVADLIVFVAGFCFGSMAGAATGALTWIVYGVLNPLGFSFPVWISTIVGEAIYGIVGGIIGMAHSGKLRAGSRVSACSLEMALWGFILTFIYDLITNVVFALTFGIPIIYALATGWLVPPWFGILHEGSNTILFSLAAIPLIRVIKNIKGGERHGCSAS